MVFQKGEYSISPDGKYIAISKECLERWRDRFARDVRERSEAELEWSMWHSEGKRCAICDILKMFEYNEIEDSKKNLA